MLPLDASTGDRHRVQVAPHARRPLARWSRTDLARASAAHPNLPRISPRTIERWLHAECIQHPAAFVERVRSVLDQYVQVRAVLQAGTWVVCADEHTAIRAREAEQPPQPACGRHVPRQSPRYTHRGARHLLVGLRVAEEQGL